ncbi:MAG TPA: permease prefix domain 1-containing protein [Kofleriaceae bacterium]|nr:permease prefix domain 1-containing protein [Kofleriaceae bacterium]
MTEEDEAIAAYRAQLLTEAELARADLDEIEDHLRALAAELRTSGMPASSAIAEAARRLGDPKQVAREHARVRSAFGAKLSRARAWSAAALLMVPLAAFAYEVLPFVGPFSHEAVEIAFGAALVLALGLRIGWARPLALGGIAFFTVLSAIAIATSSNTSLAWILPFLGLLAFLAPWRRGELAPAGLALALQVWAFGAAIFALGFMISTEDGHTYISSGAQLAFVTALIALAGGVVRARWGAIASLVSGFALAASLFEILQLRFRMHDAGVFVIAIPALVGSGALAAAIGALLAWRSARSSLGTLRGILS